MRDESLGRIVGSKQDPNDPMRSKFLFRNDSPAKATIKTFYKASLEKEKDQGLLQFYSFIMLRPRETAYL